MQVGDVIDGKYQLVRQLGTGGMGTVWEGRHLVIGRRVAIKVLHEGLARNQEVRERFRREARAAAAIGSEHIVDVEDVGFTPTPEGVPFLVMEYLEGSNLFEVLRRDGPFAPRRAADYLVQACRALSLAHERGIVHRDLKPENLFLTQREDGTPWIKVIDFGIAKLLAPETSETDSRLTALGTALGTPHYMSPEQVRGATELDHRSDVYSMGIILYEVLTGKRPFRGATVNDVIIAIVTEPPVPPREHRPELDFRLEGVILKAIARDPGERYQTIAELAQALAPFAAEPRTPAPPWTAAPTAGDPVPAATATTMAWQSVVAQEALDEPPRPARRWGSAAIVAAVLTLAGIAGLVALSADHEGDGHATTDAAATPAAVVEPEPPSTSPVAADDAEAGPAARPEVTVRLEVRATPASARVRLDGAELGTVPFEGSFAPDGGEHRLEVLAVGYEPVVRNVTLDRDRAIEIGLTRSPPPAIGRGTPPRGAASTAPAAPASPAAPTGSDGPAVLRPDPTNPYGARR